MNHFKQNQSIKTPKELQTPPNFTTNLKETLYDQLNDDPPAAEELMNTLKGLKNGKSSNDIPAIFLKSASENTDFFNEFLDLYQTIWNSNSIPKKMGMLKINNNSERSFQGKCRRSFYI